MTDFTRKINRLPFKELYQNGGWYFVTICVEDRKCIFVEESPCFPYFNQLKLNQNGEVVRQEWLAGTDFYENIILDEYVIMPNHFHGIIGFDGVPISKITQKPTNLSKIIASFKSLSYKKIKALCSNADSDNQVLKYGKQGLSSTIELIKECDTIWQKSFYDHIVRDEKDLERIREYIYNNPLNWHLDSLNPVNYKK